MCDNNEAAEHTSLLSKLKSENKALKERDWEECCEEVKAKLKTENKSLNDALEQNKIVTELLLEDYKAIKESKNRLLKLLRKILDPNDYTWCGKMIEEAIKKEEKE